MRLPINFPEGYACKTCGKHHPPRTRMWWPAYVLTCDECGDALGIPVRGEGVSEALPHTDIAA